MEIGLTLFPFVLLAIVMVLANLEERDRVFRWVTLLALVGLNLLAMLVGLVLAVIPVLGSASGMSEGLTAAYGQLGWAMALTGLVAFLPFLPPLRRLLARWLYINPDSVVVTTALVYAVYLVGSGIGQQPLLSDPAMLEQLGGAGVSHRAALGAGAGHDPAGAVGYRLPDTSQRTGDP